MGFFDPPTPMAPAPPPAVPTNPTQATYNASFGERRRTANPSVMTSPQGELTRPRTTRTSLLGE